MTRGSFNPNSPAGTRFSDGRSPWTPFSTSFRKTLPASSRTFTLRGTSSGSGVGASEWRYSRLMAVRTDAWEAAEYNESLAQSTTTSTIFSEQDVCDDGRAARRERLSRHPGAAHVGQLDINVGKEVRGAQGRRHCHPKNGSSHQLQRGMQLRDITTWLEWPT